MNPEIKQKEIFLYMKISQLCSIILKKSGGMVIEASGSGESFLRRTYNNELNNASERMAGFWKSHG